MTDTPSDNFQHTDQVALALTASDVDARRAAVDVLQTRHDDQSTRLLLSALRDASSAIRIQAATAVAERLTLDLVPVLVEWLGHDADMRVVDPLIDALTDPDMLIRDYAIHALGKLGDPRAVEPVLQALTSDRVHIRQTASSALGALGGRRAIDALTMALHDRHEGVRQNARHALVQLGKQVP